MFGEPAKEDFDAQVDEHVQSAYRAFGSGVGRIMTENAAHGRLKSGLTVRQILDELDQQFDQGCIAIIDDMHRFIRASSLKPEILRFAVDQHLVSFGLSLVQLARMQIDKLSVGGDAMQIVEKRTNAIKERLGRQLRKSDVGLWRVAGEIGVTGNTINVGTIIGGVQQGSHGSTMHVSNAIDTVAIGEAADQLSQALEDCGENSAVADLKADLATIRAQLSKPNPIRAVLIETGRSIRSVVENTVGGVLTPQAITAAATLAAMVGG